MKIEKLLGQVNEQLAELKGERSGSRFVAPGADPATVAKIAAGGSVESSDRRRVAEPTGSRQGGGPELSGSDFLRAVKAARGGDARAHEALTKGWLEGTPTAGGFFVADQTLPGYAEKRRAASPLRERCTVAQVESDTVHVVVENGTVTVQHVAEAATKPNTTGSIAEKVATNFKVAGTSHVSDELLADSNGNVGELVARQFAVQCGITIDKAIISGTGTAEPTGIRNAAGVTATAVDGQTGRELNNSILKAVGRLREDFEDYDTVVVHPRDVAKFDLAVDTQNRYLFEGGLAALLGAKLVVDANVPTNLGAGTNETVIIVGSFRDGAHFFERTPLTIDSSQDAGWVTDETVFRAVERYGFAVTRPEAFEVLTGITP